MANIWWSTALFQLLLHLPTQPCHVIGIDLGTSYSCVGVYINGQVEIVANDQGNRITPSVVAFTNDGERIVGEMAKNQAVLNPENTVYEVKRMIGRQWDEASLQEDLKVFPFKVSKVEDGRPGIEIRTDSIKKNSFP